MTQTRRVMGGQEKAYRAALKAAITKPEDESIIALGGRLAQLIDLQVGEEGESMIVVKLVSELRQILAALGMTPAARAALTGKTGPASNPLPRSPLDELKARRVAREA